MFEQYIDIVFYLVFYGDIFDEICIIFRFASNTLCFDMQSRKKTHQIFNGMRQSELFICFR